MATLLEELISSFGPTSLVLTIVVILLIYRIWNLKSSERSLPGPIHFPIVGNYFALHNRYSVGQQLAEWRKTYGDIFLFHYGSFPIVVVNSWDLIEEANRSDHFLGKFKTESAKVLSSGGNGISFEMGFIWQKMRKIAVTITRKYAEGNVLPSNVEWAVNQCLPQFPEDDKLFDPFGVLGGIMSNLAFSNIIGQSDEPATDARYHQLNKCAIKTREFFTRSDWFDYFTWTTPFFRKYSGDFEKNVYGKFLSVLRENLEEHRSTYVEEQTRDFTDALIAIQIASKEENQDLQIDDDAVCQTLFEFFQASSDSTATSLIYIVRILAQFPDIQDKIFSESERELGSERLPIQTDKLKCPYIMAVIHETLRITMPFTSGFLRSTTQDTQLGGYPIKKGTAVLLNSVAVTMDNDRWPEFDTFDPERFLNPEGSFVTSVPKTFLPFGSGKRSCFGEKSAVQHLFIATILLVRKFRFLPGPELPLTRGLKGKFHFDTLPIFYANVPKSFQISLKRRFKF